MVIGQKKTVHWKFSIALMQTRGSEKDLGESLLAIFVVTVYNSQGHL